MNVQWIVQTAILSDLQKKLNELSKQNYQIEKIEIITARVYFGMQPSFVVIAKKTVRPRMK